MEHKPPVPITTRFLILGLAIVGGMLLMPPQLWLFYHWMTIWTGVEDAHIITFAWGFFQVVGGAIRGAYFLIEGR